MRDTIFITEKVIKFMVVKVLRQCTHVLLINAAWNEGKARKVECFEAGS
jgi:predicted nucleic acid-binding Zn finger protein